MQLRIWHKMILGISIPSFIAVLGGLLSYGYINDFEGRQGFVLLANDLKEHVIEVRRNEKTFLHNKNAESLNNLRNTISALNTSISNISSEISFEAGNEVFPRLNKFIETYLKTADGLHENYMTETIITERVMKEGRQLEALAEEGNGLKELTTDFIHDLQFLEINLMLFRDQESFLKLNDSILKLGKMIPICSGCKTYIEAVNLLFNTYEAEGLLKSRLQDTGSEIEKIAVKIDSHERAKIASFITKSKRLLIAALILLCTLGPLFVYKTANYIVAPIKRIDEITKKISEGNMDLRAPIKERDETSSLALSFNTMLDHMNLTHQSLEKSMELLTEKQAQLVDSEKRASLGLLVSGVAHELNNPLNNISLIAESMTEDVLGHLSTEEVKDLNNILMQCERAKHIVNNLLDFARARKTTDMDKQDIVSVLKESFGLVANQMRINNINLEQDIPENSFYINGNRSKLEQILVSIFTNAIQAMTDHGTLSVSLKPGTDDRNILIKISDTGSGIPEEDIKNIFEPFFTTKSAGKGTGLGLSVCKSLVMEHEGEIHVESQINEGTTFTIKFPLYKESA
jgi:signal transduction histidine kinase